MSSNVFASPSVAVITVCRNALRDLQMTTQSVREQAWPALLHVVVDGASTDGTPAWMQAQSDRFAVSVSEPDAGIYDAMNKAVVVSPPTDWILFLNAGDRFIDAGILERLAPLLAQPIDFIFGDVAIRADGRTRIVKARPRARTEMPGCHQSMLVRSGVMRNLRFDTSYRVGGDFEFFLRATATRRAVAFHDGVIAEVAPEGFSAANERVLQGDYARAIRKHRGSHHAIAWLLRRRGIRAIRYVMAWFSRQEQAR